MKYVLMFVDSVESKEAWLQMPKDQLAAAYEPANKWFEEAEKTGRLAGGADLMSESTTTTVRFKNGKATVTDGPFIEAKEIIGGFAIVEVRDLDEAIAMAKAWQGGSENRAVEVRPVVDHSADIE
ncbi:MAG TPA: YciI family protein [Candidatus Dormibacteraeota bacterium]|nr:YciI family protein [Candidatus Dormibacteraeota bacterium]